MNNYQFAQILKIKKRLIQEESELWSEIPFGKHKGMTLPLLLFRDASWIFWAIANDVFRGRLSQEGEDIYQKATNIRIPKNRGKNMVVEYIVHPTAGTFVDFKIIPRDQPMGSNVWVQSEVIDMSIPHRIAGGKPDKLGHKFFVQCLKFYLFGSRSYRINQARAEEFYNDTSDFRGESDEAS